MTRRAYLYFIVTFLLGIIVGGASVFFYGWYGGRWRYDRGFDKQRIVRRMSRDLNLNETQVRQLEQIMDDSMRKFMELRKQVDPQFDSLREESNNRIRQILAPEQLTKFNEMLRRFEERRKKPPAP
jgi:Spy/CpxP family protein refolding chaperone